MIMNSARMLETLAVREFALALIDCSSSFEFSLKPVGAWRKKIKRLSGLDNNLYNISNANITVNSTYFEPSEA